MFRSRLQRSHYTPNFSLKRRRITKFFSFAVGARKIDDLYFHFVYVLNVPSLFLKMQKIQKLPYFKLFCEQKAKQNWLNIMPLPGKFPVDAHGCIVELYIFYQASAAR